MPPTHFPILTGQNDVKLYLMLAPLQIMIDQNKSNSQHRKSNFKICHPLCSETNGTRDTPTTGTI